MKDCGVRGNYKAVSESCAVAKNLKNSGGPLDNQTWQTEWTTALVAKVQLCRDP